MKIQEHYLKEKCNLSDEEIENFTYGFIRSYLRIIGLTLENHFHETEGSTVCIIDGVEFDSIKTADVLERLYEVNDKSDANKRLQKTMGKILACNIK